MAKFVPQPELSLNDQMQIRREKLAALQAEGRDPFIQTKFDFNADSAAIKADYEAFEGKAVKVAGRLMSKRGHGQGHVLRSAGPRRPHPDLRARSTSWARKNTTASRSTTSATSSAWRARSSSTKTERNVRPRQGRHPAEQVSCCPCPKSSTA